MLTAMSTGEGLPLFGISSTEGLEGLLTRRELATALDVHPMTITKWEREGLPVAHRGRKGKPSRYRETEVRAWLQRREENLHAAPGALDLITERARRERAQAILAEQAYNIRAKNLLPREEVERAWMAEVTAVRAKLLAWPTMLADQVHRVAVLEGLPGVERLLGAAVDHLLVELSQPADGPRSTTNNRRKATRA
jgi:phage terminase Nu1 subunit (DNA packaging protein)